MERGSSFPNKISATNCTAVTPLVLDCLPVIPSKDSARRQQMAKSGGGGQMAVGPAPNSPLTSSSTHNLCGVTESNGKTRVKALAFKYEHREDSSMAPSQTQKTNILNEKMYNRSEASTNFQEALALWRNQIRAASSSIDSQSSPMSFGGSKGVIARKGQSTTVAGPVSPFTSSSSVNSTDEIVPPTEFVPYPKKSEDDGSVFDMANDSCQRGFLNSTTRTVEMGEEDRGVVECDSRSIFISAADHWQQERLKDEKMKEFSSDDEFCIGNEKTYVNPTTAEGFEIAIRQLEENSAAKIAAMQREMKKLMSDASHHSDYLTSIIQSLREQLRLAKNLHDCPDGRSKDVRVQTNIRDIADDDNRRSPAIDSPGCSDRLTSSEKTVPGASLPASCCHTASDDSQSTSHHFALTRIFKKSAASPRATVVQNKTFSE